MGRVRDEVVRMVDRALGEDARDALQAVRQLRAELAWLEQRAVAHARSNGFDWGRIGRNLGMTRQGARKKFGNLPVAQPPHARDREWEQRHDIAFTKLRNQIAEGTYGESAVGDDPVFW